MTELINMADLRNASQEKKTEAFIYNARQIHEDIYSYSKSVYTRSKDKLTITCEQHGDFEQSAKKHISGRGCPYCGGCKVDMKGLSLEDHYKYTKQYIKNNYDLKTKNEYIDYWKDNDKPNFISASPDKFYKDLNFSWPSFLGTSTAYLLNKQKSKWLPFEEARKYIRKLGLKNRREWKEYLKSGNRPKNIPSSPDEKYKSDWSGWGDFLGTKRGVKWLSFSEARTFVHTLNISSSMNWESYCTSGNKPNNIPSAPKTVYKKEWAGWSNWLGTNVKGTSNSKWLPFEEAREFVHTLGLTSMTQWQAYRRENNITNIPSAPDKSYKEEYVDLEDWLGYSFLSFSDAKKKVHTFNFNSVKEWQEYWKDNVIDSVPSNPFTVYKDEWNGWVDWLGIYYLPFEEAREVVRSLNLENSHAWYAYCKNDIVEGIPKHPANVYKKEWLGFYDWLGNGREPANQIAIRNIKELLAILKSLRTKFKKLSDADKVNIILQGNAKELIKKLKSSQPSLNQLSNLNLATEETTLEETIELLEEDLEELKPTPAKKKVKDTKVEETEVEKEEEAVAIPKIFSMTTWAELLEHYSKALPANSVEELISFDVETLMGSEYSIDDEVVKAILDTKVYSLLDKILADSNILKQVPTKLPSNKFSQYILNKFWELYNAASNLDVPEHNWEHEFNLMQKIIAVRLLNEKRLGNFSGVGTGKTASALLASMLIAQKLDKPIVSLIITENNTITGWQKAISEIVPNAVVQINPDPNQHIMFNSSEMNYILYNYEKFQNYNALDYVNSILKAKPRLVIVDEIHKIKGGNQEDSKRREYISYILNNQLLREEDRYVLGMSATPLKNKLSEFQSIIESITGERHKDLDLQSTIENACLAHTKVALYAVRCKGQEPVKSTTHTVEINGKDLVSKIRSAGGNHPSVMSKILLPAKLTKLPDLLRKGTIIYTQFVEDVSSKLVKVVEDAGFTTGVYTGEADATTIIAGKDITQRQQDLKDYIDGKIDVLIGSSAVATGVDGLQRVTDNLIFITPPFTHADYIQTVGRVVRQGSAFSHIDIHHLCVVIEDADWSWDKSMYDRVEYKRNLGDAVLDGVLPDNIDITAEELTKTSKQSLEKWIDRLQTSGSNTYHRELLVVPLPEELKKELSNRYGDFSQMNKRITNELSTTTQERFAADPSEWFLYHTLYREARESWTEIPIEVIASKITNPNYTVLDLGAGEGLLADLLPDNEVIGIDYVSNHESVIEADMADLNGTIEDKSVDVLVYCLSLMSKHSWQQYLKEGHRCLKDNGVVYICTNSSSHTNETLLEELDKVGYSNSQLVKSDNNFKYYVAYKLPSVW